MENSKRSYTLDWVIVEGGPQPGVDLSNRDALIDRMEDKWREGDTPGKG
jgi:hypothetical protein